MSGGVGFVSCGRFGIHVHGWGGVIVIDLREVGDVFGRGDVTVLNRGTLFIVDGSRFAVFLRSVVGLWTWRFFKRLRCETVRIVGLSDERSERGISCEPGEVGCEVV